MQKPILSFLLAGMLLVGSLVVPSPAIATSLHLSNISSPKKWQVLYDESVEIVISVEENADISTFKAWLNGKDITERFELSDGMLRTVVGPEEGLRVHAQKMSTVRDEKGVWFIQEEKSLSLNHFQGKNALVARMDSEGCSPW